MIRDSLNPLEIGSAVLIPTQSHGNDDIALQVSIPSKSGLRF